MIGDLASAINELSIPCDSASLVEAHRLLDRLGAKVAAADVEFDRHQLWDLDAATSMRAWLQTKAGLTSRDAAVAGKIAGRLRDIPVTLAAWLNDELTGAQIQVIVANLNKRRLPVYQHVETELLETMHDESVEDTIKIMRRFAEMADALTGPDKLPDEPDSWLSLARTLDDRGELRGSFDASSTTIIDTAVGVAERRDSDDAKRTPRERRADALVDVCRFYLNHHQQPPKRRHRPHVNLIISMADLVAGTAGETIDGITIPAPDLATWVCDSTIHRVLMADTEVLDYGTAVHSAPAPLFQAVATRDRHCRWPGCDRKAKHCDAHHLTWWWHGGPTRLDNLALFCGRHHKKLHHGWHAKLLPDATIEITSPQGRVVVSPPPRAGPLLQCT